MPKREHDSLVTNMNFHNLGRLLGLNLPFFLEHPLSNQDIGKTMKILRKDVRLKLWLRQHTGDLPPREYNP